jgi:arabinogalactan oligomer/maltooligosaccharide transport system permease protein
MAIVKAVLSSIVWGLGQLFNRQWIKAAMFFFVFLIIILVEVSTGNYGTEFNLYDDKLPGEEVKEEVTNGFIENYYFNLDAVSHGAPGTQAYEDFAFLKYVAEVNGLTFETPTQAELDDADPNNDRPYFFNGTSEVEPSDVSLTAAQLNKFIADQLILVEAEAASSGTSGIEAEAALLAEEVIVEKAESEIYENAIRDARAAAGYDTLLADTITSIATDELVEAGEVITDPNWATILSDYETLNYETLLLAAEEEIFTAKYDEIYADDYQEVYDRNYLIHYVNNFDKFYNQLYGEFATENEAILAFQSYLYEKFSSGQLNMDNDDANKMLVRIYFQFRPDEYDALIYGNETQNGLDNHYYERGGFFTKGVWGVVTLGEVPLTSISNHETLGFLLPATSTDALEYSQIQIEGHHSTRLLLNGIISVIALFYLAIVWIWNIRDAYNTSIKQYGSEERLSEKKYFKDLYENFFEYIVLSPALIIISFISIMPIFFGIAVAFTNYNIEHIPPGQLVEWVGFTNFKEVFSFTSDSSIDFGSQFWKVFAWTLIWAFGATFTCFFGGFIQAVIISNKRVVFRKAWRSVLILPWAVPALISQMIFRVMFQDTGYVNQVMAKIGVTQWFIEMGFIGKTFQEAIATGPIERFFHMGTQSFEWLSNEANPWFVRIFLIVLNIWLGFPFFMALMSGVMTSIDKSLYEAASIDGATGFQKFRYITMPLVLFATSPLLVMTFSGNFNNFGVIYFITGGGPGAADFTTAFAGQTDILISWIYSLTTDPNIRWYNMASVFSILIFLIIGSVSAWNFTRTRAFREGD